ncbi:MAG: ECF transporter S component [Lachnospiraceae bacterium]|nr:ECF transporter S component [Lachnospiraceae bacterium]
MGNTVETVKTTQSFKTKQLILSALFAALTFVGTSVIKIPTITQGYIHPGDGFVLLSGLLLGPVYGTLAAGIGSALADILGGYFVYAPATFIIKALSALIAFLVFKALTKKETKTTIPQVIFAGVAGEAIMVLGYFIFEIFMLSIVNGTDLYAGVIASAAGIIPNIVQGVAGIIISSLLHPVLKGLLKRQ